MPSCFGLLGLVFAKTEGGSCAFWDTAGFRDPDVLTVAGLLPVYERPVRFKGLRGVEFRLCAPCFLRSQEAPREPWVPGRSPRAE
mmetsp:Transcript_96688/g.181805  ORF Transcript_96688/g.181805 Transcript_96688/m.181805 type:complete len:85 (-) Transcript_96688:167-421(-)